VIVEKSLRSLAWLSQSYISNHQLQILARRVYLSAVVSMSFMDSTYSPAQNQYCYPSAIRHPRPPRQIVRFVVFVKDNPRVADAAGSGAEDGRYEVIAALSPAGCTNSAKLVSKRERVVLVGQRRRLQWERSGNQILSFLASEFCTNETFTAYQLRSIAGNSVVEYGL